MTNQDYEEIRILVDAGWRLCVGCCASENVCKNCPVSTRKLMGLPPELTETEKIFLVLIWIYVPPENVSDDQRKDRVNFQRRSGLWDGLVAKGFLRRRTEGMSVPVLTHAGIDIIASLL